MYLVDTNIFLEILLDQEKRWVTVLIEEIDRENWATGGKFHIDKYGKGHGKMGKNSM